MFQVGDIVVCVDNTFETKSILSDTLTLGKLYVVTNTYNKNQDFLIITCDNEKNQRYFTKRFVSLLEYRKLKLEKICSKLAI